MAVFAGEPERYASYIERGRGENMWYIVYKNEEKTYRIESDDYESVKQDFEDLQKMDWATILETNLKA